MDGRATMQQFITLSPDQFSAFMANPPQQPLPSNTGVALRFNPTPTVLQPQNFANVYTLQGNLFDLLTTAGATSLPNIKQMDAAIIPPVFYTGIPAMTS
jgi:hypothetical protein